MRLRWFAVALSVPALFALGGLARATTGYSDRAGDVTAGRGPDITSIQVWDSPTAIAFRVRFLHAPPLRADERENWVDMLLIGIDVPPLGPGPTVPGGEWRGADFALGTHGPATTGQLVRLGKASASERRVATFKITTRGRAMTFSITRRALGNPSWFTFAVAAARESQSENGGADFAPARGTFRYVLDRA